MWSVRGVCVHDQMGRIFFHCLREKNNWKGNVNCYGPHKTEERTDRILGVFVAIGLESEG